MCSHPTFMSCFLRFGSACLKSGWRGTSSNASLWNHYRPGVEKLPVSIRCQSMRRSCTTRLYTDAPRASRQQHKGELGVALARVHACLPTQVLHALDIRQKAVVAIERVGGGLYELLHRPWPRCGGHRALRGGARIVNRESPSDAACIHTHARLEPGRVVLTPACFVIVSSWCKFGQQSSGFRLEKRPMLRADAFDLRNVQLTTRSGCH